MDEEDSYEVADELLADPAIEQPTHFTRSQLESQRHAARLRTSDYLEARFLRPYWLFGTFGSFIVFGILGYSYYVFVFISTASKWHEVGGWLGFPILLIWNIFFVMSLASYISTVFRDPGLVPLLPRRPRNDNAEQRENGGQPSAENRDPEAWTPCRRCNIIRPARAHHCSVCDRCVMKMDHHCPWVNNCVGEGNYKSFLLFVVYTGALSAFGVLCMISDLVMLEWGAMGIRDMMLLGDFIVGCIFSIMLIGFAFVHMGFVLKDETTLDTYERSRRRDPYADLESGAVKKTPRENFEAVFGPTPLLWFFPVQNHQPTPLPNSTDSTLDSQLS